MAIQLRIGAPLIALSCLTLVACDHDDNDQMVEPEPVSYSYEVTVQNLTQAQPLSPVAVVLHEDITLWSIGETASEAIEMMAEGGDNSEILANEALLSGESGAGIIAPGDSESITVTVTDEPASYLSVATMLVNTNDAFVGITGQAMAALMVNESMALSLPVWDAGTEANSELAGTIPGPADGGEGFNSERDDADTLSFHSGVVSQDDGLTDSVLTSIHRFDNPAVRIIVTRLE